MVRWDGEGRGEGAGWCIRVNFKAFSKFPKLKRALFERCLDAGLHLFCCCEREELKKQNRVAAAGKPASVSFLSARVPSDMTASCSGGRRFGKGRARRRGTSS